MGIKDSHSAPKGIWNARTIHGKIHAVTLWGNTSQVILFNPLPHSAKHCSYVTLNGGGCSEGVLRSKRRHARFSASRHTDRARQCAHPAETSRGGRGSRDQLRRWWATRAGSRAIFEIVYVCLSPPKVIRSVETTGASYTYGGFHAERVGWMLEMLKSTSPVV